STSGRRPGKEVVVERDNNEKYVDVNDELITKSGRNKDQEVYDSDNVKTVASGSKAGKGEIQGRKRSREAIMPIAEKKTDSGKITDILEYITPNTNLSNINWCDYVWRAIKTCKKGWKKGKKDSYFRGPLTVLTVSFVNFLLFI
nr:hypothetical protein CTI12_AA431800 [Tanacetum cinerariifolium]